MLIDSEPCTPRGQPEETLKVVGESRRQGLRSLRDVLRGQRPFEQSAIPRRAAIDYLKREVLFAQAVGDLLASSPGGSWPSLGLRPDGIRPLKGDFAGVADLFVEPQVKAALEPIRAAETSLIHNVADAKRTPRR